MSEFNTGEYNPFAAPTGFGDVANQFRPPGSYGGIGRLAYFGASFGLGIVNNIVAFVVGQAGVPIVLLFWLIIAIVGFVWIVVQRLQNLGMSGWWIVGIFVPILNLFVALRCLCCPEGYADHKTLDGAGKIVLGIFFGILLILLVILSARR